MKRARYILLGIVSLILVLVLDQGSKESILKLFKDHNVISLTGFFDIVLVWNQGVSFGMFAGADKPLILTALSLVICVILFVWLTRAHSLAVASALGLVMGGAIGNVIDRLRFGAVVDFLDFHIGAYHWPAFNIADSAIFIGVVLLCLDSMLTPKHLSHQRQSS